MDFMDLVIKRRSVRTYAPRPVEREKLEALAEAVRLAPSASNSQPWRVVFVDEPGLKDAVAGATFGGAVKFNAFTKGAPVIAAIVIEPPSAMGRMGAAIQGREFPLIDIGLAAAQMTLRAAELGLGTCMLGWFDERKVKRILGIPRGRRIGLLVTIGYPATEPDAISKRRKTLDEVRAYNRY